MTRARSDTLPRDAGDRLQRAELPLRSITGLFGGYAASAGFTAGLARLLPIDRAEATTWALLLSFPLFAAIGLWMFGTRRPWRAAALVWAVAIVSIAVTWSLGIRP